MSVHVDEAGRDDQALGIQYFWGGVVLQATDFGDDAGLDADIAAITGLTRSVDDQAVLDDAIEFHEARTGPLTLRRGALSGAIEFAHSRRAEYENNILNQ